MLFMYDGWTRKLREVVTRFCPWKRSNESLIRRYVQWNRRRKDRRRGR